MTYKGGHRAFSQIEEVESLLQPKTVVGVGSAAGV
jgi:hypothetical protein